MTVKVRAAPCEVEKWAEQERLKAPVSGNQSLMCWALGWVSSLHRPYWRPYPICSHRLPYDAWLKYHPLSPIVYLENLIRTLSTLFPLVIFKYPTCGGSCHSDKSAGGAVMVMGLILNKEATCLPVWSSSGIFVIPCLHHLGVPEPKLSCWAKLLASNCNPPASASRAPGLYKCELWWVRFLTDAHELLQHQSEIQLWNYKPPQSP